jgi:hypothetical protein
MSRRTWTLLAAIGCIALLALAGCGKSKSSSSAATPAPSAETSTTASAPTTTAPPTKLATTKFVFHAGLAIGAFHHFIYKPFKAGEFQHPLSHKATVLAAGLAGLFIYHELKYASKDAKASKLLKPLVAPIEAIGTKLSAARSSLASGKANPAELQGVKSELDKVASGAAAKGKPIPEQVPSFAQLSNPPQ